MIDEYGNASYDYAKGIQTYSKPASVLQGYNMTRGFLQGNPLGANNYNNVFTEGNVLNGNIVGTINILPSLKLDVNSSLSLGHSLASDYENAYYGPKVSVGGQVSKSQTKTLRQNHVQTLNWYNTFGDVHNWNAMIGHEWYDKVINYLYALAYGGYSSTLQEINNFATKDDAKGYKTEYNVEGFFGTLQYNYDLKYYLQGSYRRDASSHFDEDKRWGDFWSVGAAWIASKERFMAQTLNVVDELKVKISIGQQGNDDIGNFAYTDLYSLSKSSETSMSPSFYRKGNKDITWETTTNLNAGVEFSLLKSRINGSFDYYNKKTTDLLFWLSIPESSGSLGYYGNIGDLRNFGFEFNVTGSPIRTEDLDWSLNFNISHNKTRILKLPESKIKENGGFYEYELWYEEDGEMFNFMTYEYAGVDEHGKALFWYDEDLSSAADPSKTNVISRPGKKHSGKTDDVNKATRYAQGSILPKFYGGFGTSLGRGLTCRLRSTTSLAARSWIRSMLNS